jgi:DEAD/DEAH box helicase domain-containing protein
MLPAHIAENIKKQVLFYLQSTFSFWDRETENAFTRFIEDPDTGLFKGPWIQLRRPFRPAPEGMAIPLDIHIPFHPFLHQFNAWKRLSSKDKKPQSTIITTGTGSGKTECFLFPILDHCLRVHGQKGIKAIILYPMNALAADQEKRFARIILENPALNDAGIRVGTYTGRYDSVSPGESKDSGTTEMGETNGCCHGISSHARLLENPPDILLTNYKMLDFLLMRPQDKELWRFNPHEVLKYLVLDELHTYDGAQGADVACLIRRLKERLDISKGELCVVGTSATLDERDTGSDDAAKDAGETGRDRLARFSSTLFEEDIPPEAVIDEDRLKVEEIVASELTDIDFPDPAECEPQEDEDALAYAGRQARLWGGPVPGRNDGNADQEADEAAWRIALGKWLKQTHLFKILLDIFSRAEKSHQDPLPWNDLLDQLANLDTSFGIFAKYDVRHRLASSFIALVSHAWEIRSGQDIPRPFPLAPTQVQLWIRELRRLGRVVSDSPCFAWLDEPIHGARLLPAFHCSECGESGWIAIDDPTKENELQNQGVDGMQLLDDPAAIYRAWFGENGEKNKHLVVVSPWKGSDRPEKERLPVQLSLKDTRDFLCSDSLVLRKGDGPCPLTDSPKRLQVRVIAKTRVNPKNKVIGDPCCPTCQSQTGLFFIGSQSATLSSVAIDEMFGSVLNNAPKLLAFTDSVQDASHRAGFFTARTYHFTFRTALQHVIDAAGRQGLPLAQTGARMLSHWSQERPGFPGPAKALGTLLPPDLQQYPPYLKFRNSPLGYAPPKTLQDTIAARLTWEATSEFGVMQTHGRTMELSGSSCLGWDEIKVTDTARMLREKLPGIDPLLERIQEKDLLLWIYGFLHRYRERGALQHPYLASYAAQNFWGKYPFGRTVAGRESFPPAGRYRPRLMVTQPQTDHEFLLASSRGGNFPWHVVWSYRALGQLGVPESSILDLIGVLLKAGAQTGLLHKIHQDGLKAWYVISDNAAILYPGGTHLVCSESGRAVIRPEAEAGIWDDAPSIEYYADRGRYRIQGFTPRQLYYQNRYRKGALRRVVAQEHTGLLGTTEREKLESDFAHMQHADDPNILTCTSTLEMGIDIGDLSSTILCSMPPDTSSYLQRIGRAGRATGTALIVSFINQKPHDLFFFARPAQMLKGRIETPGCWMDASAVLARQYLGYCFDCATREKRLTHIPGNGRQLVEDMKRSNGALPGMLGWITTREAELRSRFLHRFSLENVQPDTRERFITETGTDLLTQRIHQAANEFDRLYRDMVNAAERLKTQRAALEPDEKETGREIDQELRILRGRMNTLNLTGTLQILTDFGLLPNYAFPERGVRFYGAIFNKYQEGQQEHPPVEVSRPAGTALRDLAPGNSFYTHSRQFIIQQIAIGNPQQPIIESWAICGKCGHMRRAEQLRQPGAVSCCPQCGHDGDNESQLDLGQQKQFIEFAMSQAMSQMEHYESLSGDRNEERQRERYQVLISFDQTIEAPVGAVGNEQLPFGIEYRAAMIRRDINVGYWGEPGPLPFGPGQKAPEVGFQICRNCGIVVPSGKSVEETRHRRSCQARRRYEKMRQEGKSGNPYQWENVYLYRQLRSDAIRLLLPVTDDHDIQTLIACIYLGLRLRFEGNPAHLIISPQTLPDAATGLNRQFLVLMDAVPGGTGYLKTLYQKKNADGLEGEGIMEVLRFARDALETCTCRKLVQQESAADTDGCYRCIRSYHLQYSADKISRERGIRLLNQLIEAGGLRNREKTLDAIKPDSLFGSILEKKFVQALHDYVEAQKGKWGETLIRGGQGFRFSLPDANRLWELELQPSIGLAQGVMTPSQPDFLLRCDDDDIRPVAVFTDGFEFHCHPNNRLADDMRKRRAILESGHYHVWSITWDDLTTDRPEHPMVCHPQVAKTLAEHAGKANGMKLPDAGLVVRNGMEQLKAFLHNPVGANWKVLAHFTAFWPLQLLYGKRRVFQTDLRQGLAEWRKGMAMVQPGHQDEGDWVFNDRAGLNQDIVGCISAEDILSHRQSKSIILARIGDSDAEVSGSDYPERWRRFLACLNFYQFSENFCFWSSAEIEKDTAPDLPDTARELLPQAWRNILNDASTSLRPFIHLMAGTTIPAPLVAHYNDSIDDDAFAELAWPDYTPPVAVLAGDQTAFADQWQGLGWKVVVISDLQAKGGNWLIDILKKSAKGE